ncbi:NAD(P)H-dependent glycerol-3-phosphate dehydrogenase [Clostridium sp. AM58-1XD]|uniref:NAD(P)H-dependent glycerol-3-phosphate dehydrogenase n=1 Tax=Clostridium sp. AM58-1XD TaxID=2292307 RepID=UPI000E505254|nr:NAD(P)H-dependent glycerol-3-phosphate dehydrogenase [Clostridium sp. AM58-1XD]RGZ01505.1 NAD(P)H-dependent glycerol-3-phosphate dehydrogenase [Clostridium sp. AM58-1XD]
MAKIGIIGAGSWGIALSFLLSNNGHEVCVWSALEDEVKELKETHGYHSLPGLELPLSMNFTADISEAMKDKDLLVTAVPSVFVRQTAQKMKPYCREGQIVVNVAKGIEDTTLQTLSQILEEEIPQANVAVLSGPSHAEEVSRGIPTTCVTGAHDRKTAEYIQNIFMSEVFRVYTSPDILGIELGGSLKNVIALAAGVADGLGYGDNTKAALITRGIAEITRLGMAMGGKFETFCGLSGIGDLIVTCASMHSRNRRAGILIGKGYTMEEAMKEVKMVVEGVYSAKAALALSKQYDIPMPIIEQVNEVLFDGKSAAEAVKELMLRDKRIENTGLLWEDFNTFSL